MNGFILALVLAAQCGPNGCPAPTRTAQSVGRNPWQKVAVRIESRGLLSTGWGTGALVTSDGERALVITNRHVTRDSQEIYVHHSGNAYRATPIRIASDTDLAAVVIRSPIEQFELTVAQYQPKAAFVYGYDGRSGEFHRHYGSFMGYSDTNADYRFHTHAGESGSPIISEQGELAGIAWGTYLGVTSSPTVPTQKLRDFLAAPTCLRFFQQRKPPGGSASAGKDPIPAEPTPPEPKPAAKKPEAEPEPVVPKAALKPAPAPQTTGSVAGPADLSALKKRLEALEGQVTVMSVAQPDGSSTTHTFTPQVDSKTGKRAIGIKLDLNPATVSSATTTKN